MKKIVLIMLVILGWSHAQAQRLPVLDYGLHSLEDVRNILVLPNNPKANSWRVVLRGNANPQFKSAGSSLVFTESNLASYMTSQYVWSEERELKAGTFYNSGYNPKTQKVEMYLSTADFKGFVEVFHYGSISIVLWKDNCVNLLSVPFVPLPIPPSAPTSNPMARAAEKAKEPEIQFVVLPQQQCCSGGGMIVSRQPSNTTVVLNLAINAIGGGRYNYGTPYNVSPTRQWYPQSGGPVGVPGFPANTGSPWGVNGFPANTYGNGGGPVGLNGFGTGNPVGAGGTQTFNPFGADGFAATPSNWGPN